MKGLPPPSLEPPSSVHVVFGRPSSATKASIASVELMAAIASLPHLKTFKPSLNSPQASLHGVFTAAEIQNGCTFRNPKEDTSKFYSLCSIVPAYRMWGVEDGVAWSSTYHSQGKRRDIDVVERLLFWKPSCRRFSCRLDLHRPVTSFTD